MKVYVLIQPHGSYDDYGYVIKDIYKERKDAEIEAAYLDRECVLPNADSRDKCLTYDEWLDKYGKEGGYPPEIYADIHSDKGFALMELFYADFHPCEIIEYELK